MKKYISIVILLCFCLYANAQSEKGTNLHYVFPQFIEGKITYATGGSEKKMFNYNRLTEEMIFVSKNQNLALSENDLTIIKSIEIAGHNFVVLNGKMVETTDNPNLLIQYKAALIENGVNLGYGVSSTNASTQAITNYYVSGTLYLLYLPERFKISPSITYWINDNGSFNEITNFSELKKLFNAHKKSINSYIKENNIDFNNQKQMLALMNYIETL